MSDAKVFSFYDVAVKNANTFRFSTYIEVLEFFFILILNAQTPAGSNTCVLLIGVPST